MAASKAFLVLQRCRVVYAPNIRQVLDKDLRAVQGSQGSLLFVTYTIIQGIISSEM